MTTRTEAETALLREEAQRLVRQNWKRTDISHALGVSLPTLARWALQGGWRQKDLAAEGAAERLAVIREQIAQRRTQSDTWAREHRNTATAEQQQQQQPQEHAQSLQPSRETASAGQGVGNRE